MKTVNFTTVEKLRDKLAKLAANHQLEFNEVDNTRIEARLRDAYNEIVGILTVRGLNMIQISTWARGEEFQLDIATFWFCKDSAWGARILDEKDWTKPFDRREELKTIPIISNDGTLLARATGAVAEGLDLLEVNKNLGIYP